MAEVAINIVSAERETRPGASDRPLRKCQRWFWTYASELLNHRSKVNGSIVQEEYRYTPTRHPTVFSRLPRVEALKMGVKSFSNVLHPGK